MNSIRRIAILGATGSIGSSTIDVIRRHPTRYRLVAISAYSNWRRLADLATEFEPTCVVIGDEDHANDLRSELKVRGVNSAVLQGTDGLVTAATFPEVDTVMAAIVGSAGLLSTLAAARAGKRVLLANKEALVMAGSLFMEAVRSGGGTLLPIDSEHNAIFQCLPSNAKVSPSIGIRRVLLTGSGGPFRTRARDELCDITPDEACAHPNWVMGRKISVDSATMMNKGLEIIEAHWLFDVPADLIEVVVHPQSVIHSMVEYVDGSVIAQLGHPDMRTPIAQALAYPERIDSGVAPLNFSSLKSLTFEAPDFEKFPALQLAYSALRSGGTATTAINAANEVAVSEFLAGNLPFLAITDVLRYTLDHFRQERADSIEAILEADRAARQLARNSVTSLCKDRQR